MDIRSIEEMYTNLKETFYKMIQDLSCQQLQINFDSKFKVL